MKVIQLHNGSGLRMLSVDGSFTFLNASKLIGELEHVIEQVENLGKPTKLHISLSLRFLDNGCKRIVLEYFLELNDVLKDKNAQDTTVEWKYESTDDEMKHFGRLLGEMSDVAFLLTESPNGQ